MIYTILLLAMSFSVFGNTASICRFDSLPSVRADGSNQVLTFFEKDKPIFWQEVVPDGPLALLRASISQKTIVDPIQLLRNQHLIFSRNLRDMGDLAQLFDDMEAQRVGRINTINCLEALLYNAHLSYRGIIKPTEFTAVVYKFALFGENFIKVILKSGPEASGPDLTPEITQERITPWALLHNHPFIFDNNTGDIAGTLLPSGITPPASFNEPEHDLKYFRTLAQSYGLKEAWITNGFHTSHFSLIDKTGVGKFWIY